MTKILLALCCLMLSSVAFGDAVGGRILLRIDETGNEGEYRAKVALVPSVSLRNETTLELEPRAGIMVNYDEGSSVGLLAGCGFYYHFLENKPLAISAGPDLNVRLGFSNFNGGFGITLPVNVDVELSPVLFVRGRLDVAHIGYNMTSAMVLSNRNFIFAVEVPIVPSVGFYYVF